ncbi:MAG: hypothetical protein V9E83_04210 [Baekduia sp.]
MESGGSLHEAEDAARRLATELTLPRGYDETIGAGLACVVAAGAIQGAVDKPWTTVLLALALVVFIAATARQVHRFRELNGVWISGLRPGATHRATLLGMLVYAGTVACAMLAADRGWWPLVAALAIAAGVGYIAVSRWWMRLYREEHER